MTNEEIQALDGKPVCIVTQRGVPISFGRITVSPRLEGAPELRVELVFQTETMSCVLGLPPARVPDLRASFNGDHYTHCILAGDAFWLTEPMPRSHEPQPREAHASLVDTYPVA